MKISIIIPSYNRAYIISKTLESILAQTYTDWECIIVDDKSTDNTKEVVENFVGRDKRFRYEINTRKKGAQGARNTGLQVSQADWVYFFDSDNIMHKDCLENLAAAITKEVDVVQCFSLVINKNTGLTEKTFTYKNFGNIHTQLLLGRTYVDFNHAIIRKDVLKSISGLDEDCPSMQEWDTHIRLSNCANYTTVEKFLVDYFIGSKDAISSNPKRDVIGKLNIIRKYISEIRQHPFALIRKIEYMCWLIDNVEDADFRQTEVSELKRFVPKWCWISSQILLKLSKFKSFLSA